MAFAVTNQLFYKFGNRSILLQSYLENGKNQKNFGMFIVLRPNRCEMKSQKIPYSKIVKTSCTESNAVCLMLFFLLILYKAMLLIKKNINSDVIYKMCQCFTKQNRFQETH